MLSPLETALTGQPFRRLYCRMLDELAQEWSLSRTEAEVMFLLSCDKTLDTARDICETQLLKKSAVSRAAEGLVRRGCWRRCPTPGTGGSSISDSCPLPGLSAKRSVGQERLSSVCCSRMSPWRNSSRWRRSLRR